MLDLNWSLYQKPNNTFPDFSPSIALQIINYGAMCILPFAFISTSLVFLSLLVRRFKATNKSNNNIASFPPHSLEFQKLLSQVKKTVFSDLTHDSILFLILSDFLFCVVYIPTMIARIMEGFFVDESEIQISYLLRFVELIFGQLADSMFMAAGLWSLLISISILCTVLVMKQEIQLHNFQSVSYVRDSMKSGNSNINLNELEKKKEDEKTSLLSPSISSIILSYKLKYGFLYHLFGWGIPLLSAVLWIPISVVFENNVSYFVLFTLFHDSSKNAFYITTEFVTILFRILIYFYIRSIFKVTMLGTSSSAVLKKKQQERRLLGQLSLYCLPWILFGSVMIFVRCYSSIDILTQLIHTQSIYHIQLSNFPQIHRLFLPFRAIADCVVYFILSKWFKENCKTCCQAMCCNCRKISEPVDEEILENESSEEDVLQGNGED